MLSSVADFLNLPGIKNSMVGSLPRCMLFVPNVLSSKWDQEELKPSDDVEALRNLVKKKKKGSSGLGSLVDEGLNAASDAAGSLTGSQGTAAQQKVISGYKDISKELESRGYSVMEMQYNPTSLRMMGRGSADITNMIGATDASMNQQNIFKGSVMARLAVDLFFDQFNIHDAFLQEGMMPTLGNISEMTKNMMTNINSSDTSDNRDSWFMRKWGNEYSVRMPVEGLISLLQFDATKEVIFFWSDMFFHGELTNVNATYTMFNKLGNPIRAKVSIVIEQGDTAEMFASDNASWNAAFDALFGEAGISQYTNTNNNSTFDNIVNKITG